MSLFNTSKTYLGVDIGTTSIKVAEITQVSGGSILKNYGILETQSYLERANEALQTSSLKLVDNDTAQYLRTVIDRAGITTNKAIASLPSFAAFTTLVELPVMPPEDLASTMQYQAKQYVPLPIESVTLEWFKVGERTIAGGVRRQQIFLIAILNEQIEKYRRIFQAAKLELVAMELEGVSLARIFTSGIKEPAMIIDIGARSTSFIIASNGLLKFAGQTDFAGGSLTQVLATGLNVPVRRAEELKKQGEAFGGGTTGELSTLIKPIIDVIISEAKRIKVHYEENCQEAVKLAILVGGGSQLPGLTGIIGESLGIVVKKGNPFEKIRYPAVMEPLVESLKPALSTAISLGLRSN